MTDSGARTIDEMGEAQNQRATEHRGNRVATQAAHVVDARSDARLAYRERVSPRERHERELTLLAVTVIGLSRLLEGPLLWVVAALVLAAIALGTRQVLAEGAAGYAPVPFEASILPAVLGASAVGGLRLIPLGLAVVPALVLVWLLLDAAGRLEARVYDRPSGITGEDRTAILVVGLVAAFMAFAGVASMVAGGLADPGNGGQGGPAISEAGIVTVAIGDGLVAGLIGYRLGAARLTGARVALWAAATYAGAIAISAGLLRAIAMPRLAFPALLTLVFYLWDTLRGTAPSLRRDPRFVWQSVLLVALGVAVVAWNLGLRGS